MDNISITLVCSIVGGFLGCLSYTRHLKRDIAKDTKDEVSEITKATQQLKYVLDGVNDIKLDIREMNRTISQTNEKVIRLEENLKQVNSRLDKLEGK